MYLFIVNKTIKQFLKTEHMAELCANRDKNDYMVELLLRSEVVLGSNPAYGFLITSNEGLKSSFCSEYRVGCIQQMKSSR
jgi:hypothetical protein